MARITARTRVYFRGVFLDAATRDSILWAEKTSGVGVRMAQGSWSGAAASAGTHNGGGAWDAGCAGMTTQQVQRLLRASKKAGNAVWFRPNVPGVWGPHLHGLQRTSLRQMAPGARQQVAAFDAGRDGLARNGPDRSWRPRFRKRWGFKQGRPVRA